MRMEGGPPAQPQNGCEMPLIEIDGSGITGIPAYMNGIGMARARGVAPTAKTAATIAITAVRQCFSRRLVLIALRIRGASLMLKAALAAEDRITRNDAAGAFSWPCIWPSQACRGYPRQSCGHRVQSGSHNANATQP